MSRLATTFAKRQLSPDDLRHVAHCLQRRVTAQRILITVMTLVGVPLLAVGPAIAAGLIWLTSVRYSTGGMAYQPLFWICFVILTPILFLLEIGTKGKFAEDAVVEVDDVDPRVSIMAGSSGAELVILVIFSLLGPGLVLGAYRRLSGQLQHRAAPHDRCAEVAGQLLLAEVGVDIFSLQKPGEKFEDLLTVVEYLVHYDWAGVGRGGKRVWILTDAKQHLACASS
jgi:hypothetical protein